MHQSSSYSNSNPFDIILKSLKATENKDYLSFVANELLHLPDTASNVKLCTVTSVGIFISSWVWSDESRKNQLSNNLPGMPVLDAWNTYFISNQDIAQKYGFRTDTSLFNAREASIILADVANSLVSTIFISKEQASTNNKSTAFHINNTSLLSTALHTLVPSNEQPIMRFRDSPFLFANTDGFGDTLHRSLVERRLGMKFHNVASHKHLFPINALQIQQIYSTEILSPPYAPDSIKNIQQDFLSELQQKRISDTITSSVATALGQKGIRTDVIKLNHIHQFTDDFIKGHKRRLSNPDPQYDVTAVTFIDSYGRLLNAQRPLIDTISDKVSFFHGNWLTPSNEANKNKQKNIRRWNLCNLYDLFVAIHGVGSTTGTTIKNPVNNPFLDFTLKILDLDKQNESLSGIFIVHAILACMYRSNLVASSKLSQMLECANNFSINASLRTHPQPKSSNKYINNQNYDYKHHSSGSDKSRYNVPSNSSRGHYRHDDANRSASSSLKSSRNSNDDYSRRYSNNNNNNKHQSNEHNNNNRKRKNPTDDDNKDNSTGTHKRIKTEELAARLKTLQKEHEYATEDGEINKYKEDNDDFTFDNRDQLERAVDNNNIPSKFRDDMDADDHFDDSYSIQSEDIIEEEIVEDKSNENPINTEEKNTISEETSHQQIKNEINGTVIIQELVDSELAEALFI